MFVVGDTYRWKGENVSTNEVAEVLCSFPGVLEANVYGVHWPGHDGRAGMASLLLQSVVGGKHQNEDAENEPRSHHPDHSQFSSMLESSVVASPLGFNFSEFLAFLHARLPVYSIPVFLRVRSEENSKTSTFKFRKVQFQNEGFNPNSISEPLFFWQQPPNKVHTLSSVSSSSSLSAIASSLPNTYSAPPSLSVHLESGNFSCLLRCRAPASANCYARALLFRA